MEWGQSYLVCVPVGMCWVWADTCHSLVVDLQPPEGRPVDMLVGTDTAKVLVEMFLMRVHSRVCESLIDRIGPSPQIFPFSCTIVALPPHCHVCVWGNGVQWVHATTVEVQTSSYQG